MSLNPANWWESDQWPTLLGKKPRPKEGVLMKYEVNVRPTEKTEDATEMVAVVVTIQQQVPMEATFKITVPRKDAENHDVLLKACDEQEQEQDAFGYGEPQAGEWHYHGELQYADIDVLGAEVIYSGITGVVQPD